MLPITYRTANPSDIDFLLDLRKETMTAHLQKSNLNPDTNDHLNRILYAFENASIILNHQTPIGLIKARIEGSILDLIQIQLLPKYQNQGIGRLVLLKHIRLAVLKNLRIHLDVLKVNPAIKLYSRLGFVKKSESAHSIQMEWTPPTMETTRFFMRCLTPQDAKMFYLLNSDKEVIQYTGDVSFDHIDQARTFLQNYNQYELYGLGRCAVIDKKTLDFVGWCGIKYQPDTDEYDIGFRFFKKYWNQGYATETAQFWLDLAQDVFFIPTVIGRVDLRNKSSQQVLKKIGLLPVKQIAFGNAPGLLYKLDL